MFNTLKFTIPDILLLMGIAQCLYIIIYLAFRSGRISRGTLPLIYFITMGTAFTVSFLENTLPEIFQHYEILKWVLWSLQPPLCILLMIQVAQIDKVPSLMQYSVILLVPVAYCVALYMSGQGGQQLDIWLRLSGLVAGAISLLSVWFNRNILEDLTKQKNHQERYWLILAMLLINAAFIATMLVNLGIDSGAQKIDLIKTVFGLALVYLSSTSLFRIYPQAVHIAQSKNQKTTLSVYEESVARQIENLIYVQKAYQEPTYSRADLARECEVPEALISKVLSTHFNLSFPQLMNKHRVEDAKNLLRQTNEAMSVIAKESGFNSLASFNRSFKEIVGLSPTDYKKKHG
jgi:AraC-like DNA-binding protein